LVFRRLLFILLVFHELSLGLIIIFIWEVIQFFIQF
jgi:hypothetical protein